MNKKPYATNYYKVKSNQKRMQEIASLISEEEHSEGDVQMFMRKIRRYATITELGEMVLNRLINRVLIGEPKKVDGIRTQEVRIVYNFVRELYSNKVLNYIIENDNKKNRDSGESLLF